ncbi:hypothetical protein ABT373_36550 [Streptomyces sp. NPDC000070]|uniref:hypothetical protein n=1 Tax=Streptomyces sp. NPDC000070 TaxID=3154240 RepID=UPI003318036D
MRCPVYIRFAPQGARGIWHLERVDLTVSTDQGRTYGYQVLADPGDSQRLQLGAGYGEVIHLRPVPGQQTAPAGQHATATNQHGTHSGHEGETSMPRTHTPPVGEPRVLVHSASGYVVFPYNWGGAGTEIRFGAQSHPHAGTAAAVTQGSAHGGLIWQLEQGDSGAFRMKSFAGLYLTVEDAAEGVTVKHQPHRDGGQLWHLEQPVPALNDFMIVSARNRDLALTPREGCQINDNILVRGRKGTLDQLFILREAAPSRTVNT